MPLLTDKALPSTKTASDSTDGGFASVITTASACWGPPVVPLPMSILPPVLTQVTADGFRPARSVPPTLTCALVPVPVEALGAALDAGLADWPPLEHPTSADATPRVPIAPTRRRFTAFPSLMRRPNGVVIGASTDLARRYRSQFRRSPGRLPRHGPRRETCDGEREVAGTA